MVSYADRARRGVVRTGAGARLVRCRLLLVLLLLPLAARSAPYPFQLIDLGTLGGSASRAAAVNADGAVAGEAETGDGALRAFIWRANGGMRALGMADERSSRAFDVNDEGVVVGEVTGTDGTTRAVLWREDGTPVVLPVPPGVSYATALAINNRGDVVGILEDASGARAVCWRDDAVFPLPRLPGPGFMQPLDLNGHGEVVGQVQAGEEEAFRTLGFRFPGATAADHLSRFRLVAGAPGSALHAINEQGVVAGVLMAEDGRIRPFLQGADGRDTALDDRGAWFGSAADLNDRGWVVGSVVPSYAADETACLWAEGRWYDLNETVEREAGVWLSRAVAVNDAGWLAVNGVTGEQPRAFALMPVEGSRLAAWPEVRLVVRAPGEATGPGPRYLVLTAEVRGDLPVQRVFFHEQDRLLGVVDEPPYEWGWEGALEAGRSFRVEVQGTDGRRIQSPLGTIGPDGPWSE